MRAAWWWIDRWRKSTAYTDMSAEAQGVYRNLLDELWLRDGLLPLDEDILRKVGGDWKAWPRVKNEVLLRFKKTPKGYRNETHDEVQRQAARNAEKQRRYREKKRSKSKRGGNNTGNVTRHVDGKVAGTPSPSPPEGVLTDPPPGGAARGGGLGATALAPHEAERFHHALELVRDEHPEVRDPGELKRLAAERMKANP